MIRALGKIRDFWNKWFIHSFNELLIFIEIWYYSMIFWYYSIEIWYSIVLWRQRCLQVSHLVLPFHTFIPCLSSFLSSFQIPSAYPHHAPSFPISFFPRAPNREVTTTLFSLSPPPWKLASPSASVPHEDYCLFIFILFFESGSH
jgi:hypothetical protein